LQCDYKVHTASGRKHMVSNALLLLVADAGISKRSKYGSLITGLSFSGYIFTLQQIRKSCICRYTYLVGKLSIYIRIFLAHMCKTLCISPPLFHSILSILILSPSLTFEKIVGSPTILPITLTGLAGLISSGDLLAGVGPQKMHIAFPGGQ